MSVMTQKLVVLFSQLNLPLDDPFHPDHPDNNQPTKGKASGTTSKRIQSKSSSLKSTQEPSLDSTASKDVPDETPRKPDKKKPAQEPSLDSTLSKDIPDKTPRKPDKKKPTQEPSLDSKLSKDIVTTPSEPVKTKLRLKLRLKLGANKPSSLKPSHKILQTPSAAAPHTHLPDLPHQ